jgi:hypothetical protein
MTHDPQFESQLRQALAPVAPPPGLASRIIGEAHRRQRRRFYTRAAIAAMLTLVTFPGLRWYQHHQQQQLAARQTAEKLSLALNIASRKVTQVQQRLVIEITLPQKREWNLENN